MEMGTHQELPFILALIMAFIVLIFIRKKSNAFTFYSVVITHSCTIFIYLQFEEALLLQAVAHFEHLSRKDE